MTSTVRGASEGELLWQPGPELISASTMSRFRDQVQTWHGVHLPGYESLWEWSTTELEQFWSSLRRFFEAFSPAGTRSILGADTMPGAEWFSGAVVNYAQRALDGLGDDQEVLVCVREDGVTSRLSGAQLRAEVAAFAAYLRASGVGPGERVAAYLPNAHEAVVGLLGTAAVGAIWSSCSPDFGERAVLDRFQQIAPAVLVAADGYMYAGKTFDRREVVARLRAGLPSLRRVVEVAYLYGDQTPSRGAQTWKQVMASPGQLEFEPVPFAHPLWIVYSSGTTGLPKPIVHSQGGILLEHLKALGLHADMGPSSRFFWFTTTGWMMWNYLVSGLLLGASVILYDGSPAWPSPDRLWGLIEAERITHFGTSAGHIAASMKSDVHPATSMDLSTLRFVGSTGSPLSPDGFRWVYDRVKSGVWLSSLSGGTDLCTAFLLGSPWLPVRAGVIQCRALGARVEAFDDAGQPVVDEVGELVITKPMPSMPIGFWGDADGSRYRASYFDTFPGVWRHGDWIKIRPDGGAVIYGRSDSTINRHGVRMGTAEIYRAVEEMSEVLDSLVVDLPRPGGDTFMPLFVVLAPGRDLDEVLEAAIQGRIREQVSPRHVPDLIVAVSEIPKTMSGKKLEIPVKRILQGEAPEHTVSLEALQNPMALEPFVKLAREMTTSGRDDPRLAPVPR
ncbi:MAG: acetoacetate--CoA ligase [Candidatus Dormibacteria bacterium]